MADDLVVVKEMKKSAGLRLAGQSSGQLYGPGKNILVPRGLAEAFNLEYTEAERDADGNIVPPKPAEPKAAGDQPPVDTNQPPAGPQKKKTAAAAPVQPWAAPTDQPAS